jgi:hypothetical protein
MPNKKKAKASMKKASKVLQEVDLTFESTPLELIPEQSKDNWIFFLNITVYTDNTKLFGNILLTSFGVFKFQEFIAENTHWASEYYSLRSFQFSQSTVIIATSNPKDPLIPKEVADLDKWREVEGIIET